MVKWNRKKTVTLLWDGENWRDNETGVLITGVAPPPPDLEKAAEPQFVEAGHDTPKKPPYALHTFAREEVQEMIDDAFRQHVDVFMVNNLRLELEGLKKRFNLHLEHLARPWWRRL